MSVKDTDKFPEFIHQNIKIINGDSIKYLSKMDDNSIDLVITDPPYFIDKLDNNWDAKEIKDDVKNSHIKHLPKGMKFDKKQVKDLYDFYLELSKILFKKLKPGGYFLSFSSPRLYHSIAMATEIAGFEVRDMINWVYTQTMPKGMSINHLIDKMKDLTNDKKLQLKEEYKDFKTPMIKSCFEPICVAIKPMKTTFLKNELSFKTGLLDFSQKVGIDGDKVPANIITTEEFNDVYDKNFLVKKPSEKEKGEFNSHPTVKPIGLIEHLIQLFSKKGALVVDPFLGSGTTAVACLNTERKCVGVELNKEYWTIGIKRVEPTYGSKQTEKTKNKEKSTVGVIKQVANTNNKSKKKKELEIEV
jgi:site-specific DNA-methyltransferase (adenine-specific)